MLNRADGRIHGFESWMNKYMGPSVKLRSKNSVGLTTLRGAAGREQRGKHQQQAAIEAAVNTLTAAGLPLTVKAPRSAAAATGAAAAANPEVLQRVGGKNRTVWSAPRVSGGSMNRANKMLAEAQERYESYSGWGIPPPGRAASVALFAAEAAAKSGLPPEYIWPQQVPAVLPDMLHMSSTVIQQRNNILRSIAAGAEDLSRTHISLQHLYSDMMPSTSTSSGDGNLSSSNGLGSSSGCSFSSSSSVLTAGSSAGGGSAPLRQVYKIEALQAHAAGQVQSVAAGSQAGGDAATAAAEAAAGSRRPLAVVPDATQPFTITQHNPADGQDYVVAHYEPRALAFDTTDRAALLCEVFHGRGAKHRVSRTSAQQDVMVLAGMRVPRSFVGPHAHYGRYAGDEGKQRAHLSSCHSVQRRKSCAWRSYSRCWGLGGRAGAL